MSANFISKYSIVEETATEIIFQPQLPGKRDAFVNCTDFELFTNSFAPKRPSKTAWVEFIIHRTRHILVPLADAINMYNRVEERREGNESGSHHDYKVIDAKDIDAYAKFRDDNEPRKIEQQSAVLPAAPPPIKVDGDGYVSFEELGLNVNCTTASLHRALVYKGLKGHFKIDEAGATIGYRLHQ